MDHLENLLPNIENPNLFPVDNSLNQNIFSLDNNLTGNFQNPILTASSQVPPLTLEADFTGKISDSELAPVNLNTNIIENGVYNSELAIFNLAGMEDLNPNSDEYIEEAARRALIHSADTDFNDIIFHVKDTATKATFFEEVSNSHTWHQTDTGKHSFDANQSSNPGKLEFGQAEFNTVELGVPTLSATIIRTDGDFGNVSATVYLTNGTAIANEDFDDIPIIVNFADGEIEKHITIPIESDNLAEARETVNLSLGNLTGGATLGNQKTAILNIGDEDISNIISTTSSDDSSLSLDTVNVFLKPGEEISFDITLTVPSDSSTAQIDIFPVGDDSSHIKEISLTKIAGNNYTYTVKLASDGTGGNQTITLRAEGYGDTTVNTITGLLGPYNRPPNSQHRSEYLDTNILPVQGVITGGSEEGILLNPEIENNKSIRHVGFREVNNPINVEQTWVVIHGWNDAPDGRFTDLAREIVVANPRDRVLLLDWREAAYNNSKVLGIEFGVPGRGNFRAGSWITPVAEFAVKSLKDFYGIDSQTAYQSLNLIGHSLGSLISAEMGRFYRDGMTIEKETIVTANNQGTRTITALEPPSARNRDENPFTEDPKEDIYDVDGRIHDTQAPEKFADVSVFSRAYVGEKSIAGNPGLAVTADEAFQMDFGTISEFVTDFGEEHYRVITTFTNTINQQGLIGELLGIKAYKSIDTLPIDDFDELRIRREDNGGYTGIIDVSKSDRASLLIGKSKTGKQDNIVIGSVINQEIDGSDFFNLGGDARYTGDGDDIFLGESGNDTIRGDNNDDILFGGIGKDKLNGGSGIDTFVLKPGDGSVFTDEVDVIEDFQIGTDKIGLIDINFEQLTFLELPSGFFGLFRDTAIVFNSEIIALLKNTGAEEIQKPEFFVSIDEDRLRVS